MDVSAFKNLAASFPNAVFVLHPTYPLEGSRLRSSFRDAIATAGLSYIDLADVVAPDEFLDLLHLNMSGKNKVRNAILAIM